MLFDGQEITQFTYFQQAGGIDLAPIAVELTYGLERFAMALQDVDNVFDLDGAPGVTYGDVRHRDEVEQSKYAFGQIDLPAAELHRTHRELFEANYGSGRDAAAVRPRPAGARLLPEVLAHVQSARRERRHRRHGTNGVHPARPPAGGRDCQGVGWVES